MPSATRLAGVLAVLIAVSIVSAAPQLRIASNSYQIAQIQPVPGLPGAVDVTARAGIVNGGDPAAGVTAKLMGSSPDFIVLDGNLQFGDVPKTSGGRPVLSQDTFQLRIVASPRGNAAAIERVARSVFRALVWEISCANCGGNRAPVANAGPDQTVAIGQVISLDATGSTDPDGQPLTYTWSFVSRPEGSTADLSSVSSVKPTFAPDRQGDYVIQLTVNDGALDSAPDTVQISTLNSPPVAHAGQDQRASVGEPVTLDGSGSTDVDGDSLTYMWRIASRPDGSVATIVDPSEVKPTFTPDATGTFLIELVVSDATVASAPDAMIIDTTTTNARPVADAGADMTATVGATVQLDGSFSTDPDGDTLTYHWVLNSRPPDSNAALSGADTVSPSFLIDQPGTYVVQLVVSDATLDSAPDVVTVSTVNGPPVANPGASRDVHWKTTVALDGSASSDPDGDPLGYAWSILSRPAGSNAALSDAAAIAPTFDADRPGVYVIQLIVNDGTVDSAPASVSITATNEAPLAVDDVASTAPATPVDVAVLGNDSDASGDTLSIVSVTQPAHGASSIVGTSIRYFPNAGFAGEDFFEYTVSDGAAFDTAAVTVNVQAANTAPTAVLAIAPGAVQAGSATMLDFRSSFDPDSGDAVVSYVVTLTTAPPGSGGGGVGGQQFVVGVPLETSLATLTFVPDVAGTYRFQLFVRDARLASSAVVAGELQATQPPAPGTVARVTIDRTMVFLPGVGRTAALNAIAVDEQGTEVTAVVTWSSSQPDQVSVDASGRMLAEAIGSALIVAEAGGIRSTPAFVVVAEPAPGALLVTDAQVVAVGPPLSLPTGTAPGVGTLYDVTLAGVASPPVLGTVVLAAEHAPVAGRVVSTRQEGTALIATLELAPLYDLFSQYRIDWAIDLEQFPLVPVLEDASAQVAQVAGFGSKGAQTDWRRFAALEGAPVVEPFNAFKCDGKAEASLVESKISLTPDVNLQLIVQDSPGHSKHALTGSESLIGQVGIKLKANISASGTCLAQAKFNIPIGGWISVLVMPAVRLGLGVELKGTLAVATGEISATGKVGSAQSLGWECGGATPGCRALDDIRLLDEFKFKAEAPSEHGMHVEASGHFFVLLGLDLVFVGTQDAEIVEARIGPKQSFDLGREIDQAENRSYASKYDLKLEGVVQPGSGLKAAIKKVINDDAVSLTFKGGFSVPLSESPKGTLDVSTQRVALGNTVDFTVRLTPSTVNYAVVGYNVAGIDLWRKKEGESEFSMWKSIAVTASNQDVFQYRWEPDPEDMGKNEFAAFVATELPVIPILEVGDDSVRQVEVACFSTGARSPAGPAQASVGTGSAGVSASGEVCADEWIGTASYEVFGSMKIDAQVVWKVDPVASSGSFAAYRASGTVNFFYTALEDIGCSVTPKVFTIDPEHSQLTINYGSSPAVFGVAGGIGREITIACPDTEPLDTLIDISWVTPSAGFVSNDGLTIEGGFSNELATSSFRFVRP